MPEATFLYFAYGSNMLTRRLRDPKRAPTALFEDTGFVPRYRLTFNKRSRGKVQSSGKCNMEATGADADRVYGVLFRILRADKLNLDKEEGLNKGYREDALDVTVNDEARRAVVYLATETAADLRPYHWYKEFVVRGAEEHNLPADYIQRIRDVQSQPDPDKKRREENEAILRGA